MMNLTTTNTYIVIEMDETTFTVSKDSFHVVKTLNNVILKSKFNNNNQYIFKPNDTTINGNISSVDEIYNFLLENSSSSGNGGDNSNNGIDLSNYAEVAYVNELNASTITDVDNKLSTKADIVHTHDIGDINNLQTELDGKQEKGDYITDEVLNTSINSKADIVHTHDIGDINNLQTELDGKSELTHNHDINEINGLQAKFEDLQKQINLLVSRIEALENPSE